MTKKLLAVVSVLFFLSAVTLAWWWFDWKLSAVLALFYLSTRIERWLDKVDVKVEISKLVKPTRKRRTKTKTQ